MDDLLTIVESILLDSSKTAHIVTPNPEQVIQSRSDHQFLKDLQAADLRLPDGIGLVWASRLLAKQNKGRIIPQRISGRELVNALLKLSVKFQLSCLVVGGREYSLDHQYPSLLSLPGKVYWTPGYENILKPKQDEEMQLVEIIKKLRPGIIFTAFGAPAQERWMMEHRQLFDESNVKIVMAVGGSFDQLLGRVPAAPKWLSDIGGEWLFRLVTQPWRWRRQLRLINFCWLTIKEALSKSASAS